MRDLQRLEIRRKQRFDTRCRTGSKDQTERDIL